MKGLPNVKQQLPRATCKARTSTSRESFCHSTGVQAEWNQPNSLVLPGRGDHVCIFLWDGYKGSASRHCLQSNRVTFILELSFGTIEVGFYTLPRVVALPTLPFKQKSDCRCVSMIWAKLSWLDGQTCGILRVRFHVCLLCMLYRLLCRLGWRGIMVLSILEWKSTGWSGSELTLLFKSKSYRPRRLDDQCLE